MNTKMHYQSPEIDVVEIVTEGGLLADSLDLGLNKQGDELEW